MWAGASNKTAPSAPTNGRRATRASRINRSNWASSRTSASVPAPNLGVDPRLDRREAGRARPRRDLRIGKARLFDERAQPLPIAQDERRSQRLRNIVAEQLLNHTGQRRVPRRLLQRCPDRDGQPPTRSEYPRHLPQGSRPILEEHQPELAGHRVEAAARERQRLRSAALHSISGAFRRATASIPSLTSTPTTVPVGPASSAIARASTPVPHATSSTRSPEQTSNVSATRSPTARTRCEQEILVHLGSLTGHLSSLARAHRQLPDVTPPVDCWAWPTVDGRPRLARADHPLLHRMRGRRPLASSGSTT